MEPGGRHAKPLSRVLDDYHGHPSHGERKGADRTMTGEKTALFALDDTRDLGECIAEQLGVQLAEHEERGFEDGEHKARPTANVRNREAFVIQALYTDPERTVNDKLCRLLFFLGALRDASAACVTAVVPYLCYARKNLSGRPRPCASR